MKKNIKIILITILSLGLATGLFFFVQYQINVYKQLVFVSQKSALYENFLATNFPDQVKAFNDSLPKPTQ